MGVIKEIRKPYIEYFGNTETFQNLDEKDKEFWKDYDIVIRLVRDENGRSWHEFEHIKTSHLANGAASNLLTSSVSS